jgi:hypothetical protein
LAGERREDEEHLLGQQLSLAVLRQLAGSGVERKICEANDVGRECMHPAAPSDIIIRFPAGNQV